MSAVIPCPGCQAPLAVGPHLVGQTIACPACGKLIQLAGGAPAPALQQVPAVPAFAAPGNRAIAATSAPASERKPSPAQAPKAPGISAAVVVGWGVIVCLLIGSGILLYALRVRAMAEREAAAAAAQGETAPASSVVTPQAPETNADKPGAFERSPNTGIASGARRSDSHSLPPPGRASQPVTPNSGLPLGIPPGVATNSNPAPMPPSNIASSPPPGFPPPQPAPTENSPTPQPSSSIGDPLAGLSDTWNLPPLISSQPQRLTTLGQLAGEPVRMAVRSLAADLPEGAAIFSEEATPGEEWHVGYATNLESDEGKVPLGAIRLDGSDLFFQWTEPLADPALRKQLANCLIELRQGNALHVAQFRAAARPGPCTVDLADDVQMVEFPIAAMPKAALLQLEVRDLVGFPSSAALKDEKRIITPGGRTIIEFSEMPGAEIGLQLLKLPTGVLVVRIESEFRENAARKFDMTLARLDALEKGMEKTLASAQKELPIAQVNLQALQSNLQSAASSPVRSLQQQTVRDQLVSSLSNKVKSASKKVVSLQKQIVESEARLGAVPKIRDFLESIHQKAQIKFVVSAECGERDLVLIDATQEASQGAE